mmetsp:Transcript_103842/g.206406  ORF Transcript_103842/g.206406 Transcript_103842/m.206406 type:complete len:114 (+) Transcript_103842:175-516(+)
MCAPAEGAGNRVDALGYPAKKLSTVPPLLDMKRARTCGQKPGRLQGLDSATVMPWHSGEFTVSGALGLRVRFCMPLVHGPVELQSDQRDHDSVGQILLDTPSSAMAKAAPCSI